MSLAKVPLLPYYSSTNAYEIGVDEAGRGPLFGRVYVAAVILPSEQSSRAAFPPREPNGPPKESDANFRYDLMRDSKKIKSKKKMRELADYIKTNAVAWCVRYADADDIDKNGILNCVIREMHNCILELTANRKFADGLALIDGNYFKLLTKWNPMTEELDVMPHQTVEKGDGTYASIAAASILAKYERDAYIEELCVKEPELVTKYGLNTNMGYGTKAHYDGIKQHGITQWHRKSYKGVA
jgi:ribonuclease HII